MIAVRPVDNSLYKVDYGLPFSIAIHISSSSLALGDSAFALIANRQRSSTRLVPRLCF